MPFFHWGLQLTPPGIDDTVHFKVFYCFLEKLCNYSLQLYSVFPLVVGVSQKTKPSGSWES